MGPRNPYLGFNPTLDQAGVLAPFYSRYGQSLRRTSPITTALYLPTDPQRAKGAPFLNYAGVQLYKAPLTSSGLFADTEGYTGIAPLSLQPIINRPYPYQVK